MFQKHMFASVHNRTWMSQQNNKKTSSQDLYQAALQYKFQEPQKLQKKNENENWIGIYNINWAENYLRWAKDNLFSVMWHLHFLHHNFNVFLFVFTKSLS